jgi:hypothetical protein
MVGNLSQAGLMGSVILNAKEKQQWADPHSYIPLEISNVEKMTSE